MKTVLVIVVGLLATLATEMTVAAILGYAPLDWPVIERYWLLAALPAIVIVVLLCTVLLWVIFRRGLVRDPVLFTLAFMAGLAIELTVFLNPPETVAAYLAIAFAVCLVILGGAWRSFWRPAR